MRSKFPKFFTASQRLLNMQLPRSFNSWQPSIVYMTHILWINPKEKREQNKSSITNLIDDYGFSAQSSKEADDLCFYYFLYFLWHLLLVLAQNGRKLFNIYYSYQKIIFNQVKSEIYLSISKLESSVLCHIDVTAWWSLSIFFSVFCLNLSIQTMKLFVKPTFSSQSKIFIFSLKLCWSRWCHSKTYQKTWFMVLHCLHFYP